MRVLVLLFLVAAAAAAPTLSLTRYQTCLVVPGKGPFGAACAAANACAADPRKCASFNATAFVGEVAAAVGGARVKSMRLAGASRVQSRRIGVDTYQMALELRAVLEAVANAPPSTASLTLNCPPMSSAP